MPKIVIDPGHGGSDPGAAGNDLREKDLTLAISKLIRDELLTYEGVEVFLTRDADKDVSLSERARIANALKADLFVSIHINSFSSPNARGFESYIHSSLNDTSQTVKIRNEVHARVAAVFSAKGSPDRGKKKANFAVLRETAMPALLTENGFISSPDDAHLLKDTSFLRNVAVAHAEGIAAAFNLAKKKKTTPAVTSFAASAREAKLGEGIRLSFTARDDAGIFKAVLYREDYDTNGNLKQSFRAVQSKYVTPGKSISETFVDVPSEPGVYRYGVHVVNVNYGWNDERNSQSGFSPGVYGPVEVKVRATTPAAETKLYIVQIGAFNNRENAERLAQRAREAGFPAIVKDS